MMFELVLHGISGQVKPSYVHLSFKIKTSCKVEHCVCQNLLSAMDVKIRWSYKDEHRVIIHIFYSTSPLRGDHKLCFVDIVEYLVLYLYE